MFTLKAVYNMTGEQIGRKRNIGLVEDIGILSPCMFDITNMALAQGLERLSKKSWSQQLLTSLRQSRSQQPPIFLALKCLNLNNLDIF
jgi:hypothetical protein